MPDWRPALVALVPGLVIAQNWLRLERPQHGGGLALLLVVLALVPALAPRLWQRLALAARSRRSPPPISHRGAPLLHPGRAATRFTNGVLDFYDVRLPFDGSFHPEMHALVLAAAFGFTARARARRGIATAARGDARARRRRRLARDAALGRARPAPRRRDPRGRAAAPRGASPGRRPHVLPRRPRRRDPRRRRGRGHDAAGRGQERVPDWQTWDPYTRPTARSASRYVWDANYDGFRWPRKTTTVLKVQGAGALALLARDDARPLHRRRGGSRT